MRADDPRLTDVPIRPPAGPPAFLPRLTDLWRHGELPLDKLVTRFSFDRFGEAWTAAKTGRAVKPVVVIGR